MPALSTPHSRMTTPLDVPVPAHWAFGPDIEVLPRIFDDEITLAVMERRLDSTLTLAIQAQLDGQRGLEWQWRGEPGRAMQEDLTCRLPAPEAGKALVEDIGTIAEAMAYLFSTETIGIRLRTLEGAMCPRFHVDNLPVRLVSTYAGLASEWLPEHAANRAGLGAPHPEKPETVADPGAIQQLGVGELALLKGCGWIGNEERGLIHRSPQPAAGERRLLLALDPG